MPQEYDYNEMIASHGCCTRLKGEQLDCAVKALSATFEIPYDEAHAFAATQWKRKSRRRTTTSQILKTMSEASKTPIFGKSAKPVSVVNSYPTPKKVVKCRTKLYTFAKNHSEGTFYVLKRGHAFVVKNGEVLDDTKPGSIVQHAWKIEDTGK